MDGRPGRVVSLRADPTLAGNVLLDAGGSVNPLDDAVLAAWAPAGRGQIVVVLGQGVVIHKAVAAGRALVAGTGLVPEPGGPSAEQPAVMRAVPDRDLHRSPFIGKVLRDGVPGLLASPRKTLVRWDEITSAEHRTLALRRGRMVITTPSTEHKLKFLQNTFVAGDPVAVFTHFLGGRFTGAR